MSYSFFQKKNPSWPKRLKDALGRKIALVRNVVTVGGDRFEAGLIMVIVSVHRGKLTLRAAGVLYGAPRSWIRQVALCDVRLLPV